ncbi:hypothetical protein HII36_11370 [Nonomuraea sp. NN258]|uniref:hypothetical protein n=1 Tax=Nonomuraea antri TaxID=2730852 RepID=UPI0015685E26|nr:hypothetical protein [Nonomuraea antri]NRQ32434.1 hypothetical protein [Nonomuraea antri]
MITFIVFAIAALCGLIAVLSLALSGWAVVELGIFLHRHPDGARAGLRELATGAQRVWPAAKTSSQIAGRRVLRSRPGRWAVRVGRASAAGAYATATSRVRRSAPGSARRGTGGLGPRRPRLARRQRLRR